MKLPNVQEYALRLKSKRSYEVRLQGQQSKRFQRAASRICGKLYVVMKDQNIHYVGITNRPMSARINYGLKVKGTRGYYGYRWKSLKGELRLLVWSFEDRQGKKFLRQLEAVEAEFAYLVRNETGQWPLSQTEIHFYNADSLHRKAAGEMLAECRKTRNKRVVGDTSF